MFKKRNHPHSTLPTPPHLTDQPFPPKEAEDRAADAGSLPDFGAAEVWVVVWDLQEASVVGGEEIKMEQS